MTRLGLLDRLLVALFVPLWLACFGLSVHGAIQHTGYPSVLISASAEPDGYPSLIGFVPAFPGEDSGLRIGDRLLRVGERDLLGRGHLALYGPFARRRGDGGSITVRFERGGEIRETELVVGSFRIYWPRAAASAVFAFTALMLLLRAPTTAMVRVFAQTYMSVALLLASNFAGSTVVIYASVAVHVSSLALAAPLSVRGALMFPHGRPPESRLARLGPLAFALLGPLDVSRFNELPFSRDVGTWGMGVGGLVLFVLLLGIMTRTYRRSDLIGRRQLRWFLYGLYLAISVPLGAGVLAALDVRFVSVLVASLAGLALIPLFLLISIARYNLFDIDRLISSTASYSIIGIALLFGLIAGVPGMALAVGPPMGVEPTTAQVLLSLGLAAVLVPLHFLLRPRIERTFFGERWALDQAFETLLEDLSGCADPAELARLAGDRLDELLRPESCVIYATAGQSFAPVYVRGRAIPPAFDAASLLVSTLRKRRRPLAAERFIRPRSGIELSSFDRAALQTLGVPVVAPVRRDDDLIAFLCLGPKRSGDVYTSTDLALLATVADKVSGELLRFDQLKMLRQARRMQESLRRYVPGALVEHLKSGDDLREGEREVTVFFVDIRGYATLTEGLEPAEIFSTVNRYTTLVSELVRKSGGSVVEFNGDGMMAVFGAPDELQHKERAAVRAARPVCLTFPRVPQAFRCVGRAGR